MKRTSIFSLKKNVYRVLNLRNLYPHPLQPPCRALKERVTDLLRTVTNSGVIDAPVVLEIPGKPGYYWVCNGNRRIAVAILLGLTRLECKILPKGTDASEAWIQHNTGTKPVSGAEVLTAIGRTSNATERTVLLRTLVKGRVGLANQIQQMAEVLGWATVCRLGRAGDAAPNRVTRFNTIMKFGRQFGKSEVNDPKFQRQIMLWFFTFDTYREVGDASRYFEKSQGPTIFDALLRCIKQNKPFVLDSYL